MATAPKMKPVKGAGKQKGPAQTPNSEATSAPSLFQQGMWAARDLWMGPPDGELGKIGKLENEIWACESSTEEAIRSAEPAEKLSALRRGVAELQEKLCASAISYYNKCFQLALRNKTELDATLSVVAAELGHTSHISSPAEFARVFTTGDLSTFLRVTALDGKDKAHEIGSDGRVREFIRHVCGDYSDVLVNPDAEENVVFLLPRWPRGRGIGAKMAQWWLPPANGDESSPFTLEETEEFILGTEEILIKDLRRAIAHAHRIALVDQATVVITTSSPSDTGVIAAYPRSALRRHIKNCLTNYPRASALEVCAYLDEQDVDNIPPSWLKNGNRELSVAYRDKEVRAKIDSMISKVRHDLTKLRG